MRRHLPRLVLAPLLCSLSGCTTTPVTNTPIHSVAPPTPTSLVQSDVQTFDLIFWGCLVLAGLTYAFRKWLPFNGGTSKVLISIGGVAVLLKYTFVLMLPYMTIIVMSLLALGAFALITWGAPHVKNLLRNALRRWGSDAGPDES